MTFFKWRRPMFLRPRLLSTDSLDLRVLNIEAFKSESVSTMLNALNIYARSAEIRLHLFLRHHCWSDRGDREEEKREKRERVERVEGRARNPRQYPVLAKRIAVSEAVLINFADFRAKSTLAAIQLVVSSGYLRVNGQNACILALLCFVRSSAPSIS